MELIDVTTEKGKIPLPRQAPRRQWWYPMPDRHKVKAKVDKSLIGETVNVSRLIVRAGYLFQHTDIDTWNIREYIDRELEKQLRELPMFWQVDENRLKQSLRKFEEIFGRPALNKAVYRARQRWIDEIYSLEEYKQYKGLRTFWYVNIKDIDPDEIREAKIVGIKRHMLGEYYQGGGAYQDYWGEWDDDPSGLSGASNHAVYQITGLFGRNQEDYCGSDIGDKYIAELHPMDIVT